jgi:hypothetical protein
MIIYLGYGCPEIPSLTANHLTTLFMLRRMLTAVGKLLTFTMETIPVDNQKVLSKIEVAQLVAAE